jgi:chaperonin GroES
MFEKLRPLHNNVLIKKIEDKPKTSGGLYIPDSAKQDTQTGTIIAVGNGALNHKGEVIPMTVQIGDTIFFGKYAGVKADEHYVVLKEDEILGILDK